MLLGKDESHCEWSAVRDEAHEVRALMTTLANRGSKVLGHRQIFHTSSKDIGFGVLGSCVVILYRDREGVLA